MKWFNAGIREDEEENIHYSGNMFSEENTEDLVNILMY